MDDYDYDDDIINNMTMMKIIILSFSPFPTPKASNASVTIPSKLNSWVLAQSTEKVNFKFKRFINWNWNYFAWILQKLSIISKYQTNYIVELTFFKFSKRFCLERQLANLGGESLWKSASQVLKYTHGVMKIHLVNVKLSWKSVIQLYLPGACWGCLCRHCHRELRQDLN